MTPPKKKIPKLPKSLPLLKAVAQGLRISRLGPEGKDDAKPRYQSPEWIRKAYHEKPLKPTGRYRRREALPRRKEVGGVTYHVYADETAYEQVNRWGTLRRVHDQKLLKKLGIKKAAS